MTSLPDLTRYQPHRVIEDIDLDGVVVPGLRGSFYRRPDGDRTHTVGVYEHGGRRLFMAWGYVGEEHCRFTALHGPQGWGPPTEGCPPVRVRRDGGRVTVSVGRHSLDATGGHPPATPLPDPA